MDSILEAVWVIVDNTILPPVRIILMPFIFLRDLILGEALAIGGPHESSSGDNVTQVHMDKELFDELCRKGVMANTGGHEVLKDSETVKVDKEAGQQFLNGVQLAKYLLAAKKDLANIDCDLDVNPKILRRLRGELDAGSITKNWRVLKSQLTDLEIQNDIFTEQELAANKD